MLKTRKQKKCKSCEQEMSQFDINSKCPKCRLKIKPKRKLIRKKLIRKPKIKKFAPTLGKAKKKAWAWFSKYIRLRDNMICVTCGHRELSLTSNIQAGHFISKRKGNSIYFEERNVHAQCYNCNVRFMGNIGEYTLFMERTYGKHIIQELVTLSNTTVQYTMNDYETMFHKYKKLAIELAEKKGISL